MGLVTKNKTNTATCCEAISSLSKATGFLRKLIHVGIITIMLLCSSLALRPASAEHTGPVSRQQLKAVYLYNFLYFATWPDDKTAAQPATAPFIIGMVGKSPVKQALQNLEASIQSSGKKHIKIMYYEHYSPGLDFSACHIIFISSSEKDHFTAIINDLQNAPILSVAEDNAFLDAGGMITIREHQQKLRYQINRKAVAKAGLRLNSQLLKSALAY